MKTTQSTAVRHSRQLMRDAAVMHWMLSVESDGLARWQTHLGCILCRYRIRSPASMAAESISYICENISIEVKQFC